MLPLSFTPVDRRPLILFLGHFFPPHPSLIATATETVNLSTETFNLTTKAINLSTETFNF